MIIIATLLIGFLLLHGGSKLAIDSAARIARLLGISPVFIGLTVIAYGTSIPEMGVSIYAVIAGSDDVSFGNIVGSNIVNIGVVVGLAAIVHPLGMDSWTARRGVPITIVSSLLMVLFALDLQVSRVEGLAALLLLAASTFYSYRMSTNRQETANLSPREAGARSWPIETAKIAAGIVLVILGSQLFFDGALAIARMLGISERITGLTLVAVGTSLPEIATTLAAVHRRQTGMAVGNVVGSNIFNMLGIGGMTAALGGLEVSPLFSIDTLVMVLFSLALIPIARTGHRVEKWEGIALMAGYIAYVYALIAFLRA